MKPVVRNRLRSIDEASAELGLSRATIYRLKARGHLKFVRIFSRTMIDAEDIERLITSNKA